MLNESALSFTIFQSFLNKENKQPICNIKFHANTAANLQPNAQITVLFIAAVSVYVYIYIYIYAL